MEIIQLIRYALRQMRKRWILSAATALSLALCIGLNSSIFSVFNAALLRPLPFPESERIVEIFNTYPDGGLEKGSSNIELYTVYGQEVSAFEGLALFSLESLSFGGAEGVERITALQASVDSFETLRMAPAIGAGFLPEHGLPGQDTVALLTDGFWQRAFAADPSVVGTKVELDGRSYEILGILPESFRRFSVEADVVVPYSWDPAEIDLSHRHLNYAFLIGRLSEDSSIAEAQAQIDSIDAVYREENPQTAAFLERAGHRSFVKVHQKERVSSVKGTLYLLNGFALAILIIGALNITNLRWAAMVSREREFTIRRVLGGSRSQLSLQLLVEVAVLAIIGGFLGLLSAYLSLDFLRTVFSEIVRDSESIRLDSLVFLWAGGLVLLTIIIVGLLPLKMLGKVNFQSLLAENGRTATSAQSGWVRSVIVILQTGLAVLLLSGTLLFVSSFWKALQVDPGFQAEDLHTFRVSLPESRYPDVEGRIAMVKRILGGLEGIPSVESAAGSSALPILTGMPYLTFAQFGDDPMSQEVQKAADNFAVTEGFFDVFKLPLLDGRSFRLSDDAESPEYLIVDTTMSDRYFEGRAVGERMTFGLTPEEDADWPTVVGTVPRIVHRELTDLNQAPLVYRSYYQLPYPRVSFIFRSERSHGDVMKEVRGLMKQLDPQLPIYLTGELDLMIEDTLESRSSMMWLTLFLAFIAILLAMAGIYGAQSYQVQVNLRSLAVRAALGATPGSLSGRTLILGLKPVIVGLLVGFILTAAIGPRVDEMAYAVSLRNPYLLCSVLISVLCLSIAALLLPARAASRVQVARLLKED